MRTKKILRIFTAECLSMFFWKNTFWWLVFFDNNGCMVLFDGIFNGNPWCLLLFWGQANQKKPTTLNWDLCVCICWFVGSLCPYFYYRKWSLLIHHYINSEPMFFWGQVAQPIPIHKPTAWTVKSLTKYGAPFSKKKRPFARSTPPVQPSEKKPSGSVNVPRSDVSVLFFCGSLSSCSRCVISWL